LLEPGHQTDEVKCVVIAWDGAGALGNGAETDDADMFFCGRSRRRVHALALV